PRSCMMARNHSARGDFLRQLARSTVAWLVLFVLVSLVLGSLGYRWAPASATGQIVALGLSTVAGLGLHAWMLLPHPSAFADLQREQGAPVALVRRYWIVGCLVGFAATFFGVIPTAEIGPAELVWFRRQDASYETQQRPAAQTELAGLDGKHRLDHYLTTSNRV